MILEAFKRFKPIRNMVVGEEGYGQPGSIFRDENGRHWLNLNGKVSSKCTGFLTPEIKRLGPEDADFEVETHHLITPFCGNSHAFRRSQDFICIDDDGFPSFRNLSEMERQARFGENADQKADENSPYAEILAPLYDIFLPSDILNEVLIRTGVPEVIRGERPVFNGIILYGPGGTGKTALQKAVSQVFRNAEAVSAELNVAALSEKYIGSLAHNLDERIAEILQKADKAGKPAFVFLDEATSLVMSAASHNTSGVDYYQEAVDVLKKYISNYPQLVFSITTNAAPDLFDDTLIRDGRLAPIRIGHPGDAEKTAMWEFFLTKHEVISDLTEDQYSLLSKRIPKETGAFISAFCKSYLPRKKLSMETSQAGSDRLLDALAAGHFVSMDQVRASISFDGILRDVDRALKRKNKNKGNKTASVGFLGSSRKTVETDESPTLPEH